jgi:hypothetical protein
MLRLALMLMPRPLCRNDFVRKKDGAEMGFSAPAHAYTPKTRPMT